MAGIPIVLRDFDPAEAISLSQAAYFLKRTQETVRRIVANNWLGRKIGGRWWVSLPALLMWADSDGRALADYHEGKKDAPAVKRYFERAASLRSKGGLLHG